MSQQRTVSKNDTFDLTSNDITNTKHFQSLKFAAETRRLPLLIFWIFMGVSVLVAGALAHHRTSWQGFWNKEATLDRQEVIRKIPMGLLFDSFITSLNVIFVKGGWIVAMIVIICVQIFYLGLLATRRDGVQALRFLRDFKIITMVGIESLVLVAGTFYFLFCTWSFKRIAKKIGSCTQPDGTFTFPSSIDSCKDLFKGFDISGHCFLIVHSCLFVLEYASKVLFVWRCKEEKVGRGCGCGFGADGADDCDRDGEEDKDSDVESVQSSSDQDTRTIILKSNNQFNRNKSKYQMTLIIFLTTIVALCLSEFLIFLQTILFYHTVLEKILGTFIGAGFWVSLYFLSRKYPHLF